LRLLAEAPDQTASATRLILGRNDSANDSPAPRLRQDCYHFGQSRIC